MTCACDKQYVHVVVCSIRIFERQTVFCLIATIEYKNEFRIFLYFSRNFFFFSKNFVRWINVPCEWSAT